MDSGWDHRALPRWDCSIRNYPDQRLLTAPRTLSWSTTSFFGCWRQGIHTYALCSLTYIGSSKSTTAAASRLTSSGARLTYLTGTLHLTPCGRARESSPGTRFRESLFQASWFLRTSPPVLLSLAHLDSSLARPIEVNSFGLSFGLHLPLTAACAAPRGY